MHPFTCLTLFLWVVVSTFTLPLMGQVILMSLLTLILLQRSRRNVRLLKLALWLTLPMMFSLLLFHGWIIPGNSLFSAADYSGIIQGGKIGIRVSLLIAGGLLFVDLTPASRLMAAMGQAGYSTRAAYLLVSPLLLVARINSLIKSVRKAQKARGHNPGGTILARLSSSLGLIFPVITCALSDIHQRAVALDSRGFRYSGQRTVCFPCADRPAERAGRYVLLTFAVTQLFIRFVLIRFI
ncbi:energy-coupling factor transporter transmembrane protein EcfT [Endozoicomonas gorgoniicola]|uniref:Energy-coupling factor transporter transmembrane protein EcfT n=1 Tax=Endozoicomonas gorgoniicola TaxID=1234144 RepID=A0ABT3MSF9_9GAMM|nr:energy-coupling factor transporter transmembrane component T [Endozoicomonas gorgoniicola]MCW7552302.1 energy-coupling factor transporter transmembrane protein EcfT [Endozoicomonas gorgoniicola]